MKRQEMILGYVLVVLSGIFYFLTFRLPENARIYPLFVITLLFLLSVLHLVLTYRKTEDSDTSKAIKMTSEQKKRGLLITVASAIYIALLPIIGYIVTTIIYIIGVLFSLDVDKKKAVLISVVFTALVYALFNNLLRVPLPKGLLI